MISARSRLLAGSLNRQIVVFLWVSLQVEKLSERAVAVDGEFVGCIDIGADVHAGGLDVGSQR